MRLVSICCLLIRSLQALSPKGLAINDPETKIIDTLLTSYNINTRPILDKSKAVNVRVELVPRELIEVNEKYQFLTISAWLRLYWKDEHLTWEESDYEGISNVRIYPTAIWRPDIVVDNEASDHQQDLGGLYPAIISSNGSVAWFTKRFYKTTCAMDVVYFPWDTQKCKFLFSSWTYDSRGIDVNVSSTQAETELFSLSGQWTLEDIQISKYLFYVSCCENPYSGIEFTLVLRRKPLYYIVNLVIPAVCISSVGTMVFCLPADSGEKVSMSVSILVSSTVFLTIFSDALPTQSDVIPLAGKLFLVGFVFMSISTMLTVIVLHVHSNGKHGTRLPPQIRTMFSERLGRVLMCAREDRHVHKQQRGVDKRSLGMRTPVLADPVIATSVLAASVAVARGKTVVESRDKQQHFASSTRHVRPTLDKTSSRQLLEDRFLASYSDRLKRTGKVDSEKTSEANQYHNDREWIHLALVLDRLFLVVFLFSLIVTCVVIFVND